MTEYDNILIASLESFLNGKTFSAEIEKDTAELLIKRARTQKVLPIVFLKNSQALKVSLSEDEYLKIRTEVAFSVSSQLQRNDELLRICSVLSENEVDYIVFKGAVCRAMYSDSEYRISADEDLLVGKDSIEKAKQLLLANGYRLVKQNGGELKLINPALNFLVELHISLVDESVSDAMKELSELFNSQLKKSVSVNIGDGAVKTFPPTFGFLALCVHFFNHFVRGGIGIRSVMDIACYIKNFRDETDFDFCFSVLKKINADKIIRTVMTICSEYFNVKTDASEEERLVDILLEDIMSAGAYGTADGARLHGGAVTKGMMKSQKSFVHTAISMLIPSEKEIVAKHPELSGKKSEIRKYRFKRIANYANKKGSFKTLKAAGKRKKVLKELGIIK